MTSITNCTEPCFAMMTGTKNCKILTVKCSGKDNCPFYKPEGCKDWIRVVRDNEEWIMPPEEYFG